MITKFKLFEYVDCDYCDSGYKLIHDYYEDGLQGLYSKKEIKKRVIDFCKDDFPYGLNNIPEPLILYRLLNVDKQEDINTDKLGIHYVGDKSMFDDEDFLFSSSLLSGNDPVRNWFIVTIQTNEDNINIESTLSNRAEYSTEYEFTIKSDDNLKILNIEQMDNEIYKD